MSFFDIVNPPGLGRASGYSHGLLAPAGGRLLFIAGQTAVTDDAVNVSDFPSQFASALDKVLEVVRAAGGTPEQVARMTVYVRDMAAYLEARGALRDAWQQRMGAHYPAMALVEVTRLVDKRAVVEIEATAVIP